MNSDNLKFISNNGKGIQKLEKRLKMLKYLKNNISPNGFIFLQESHSSLDDKKGGAMSLMAIYIFLMKKLIRAV